MERSSVVVSVKPFVVLVAICLISILATGGVEAGRDVPSVLNNHEVNDGQTLTTTTTNLLPTQVWSPYMAYTPEGAFESSKFIFDPHFGFHNPWWFWGFHGFPFHHFGGMKAQGGGSNNIPVGKYEGGEVAEVGGKVAAKTP